MKIYTFIDSSEDLGLKNELTVWPSKDEAMAEMKVYMLDGADATLVVLEVLSTQPYEFTIRPKKS